MYDMKTRPMDLQNEHLWTNNTVTNQPIYLPRKTRTMKSLFLQAAVACVRLLEKLSKSEVTEQLTS